MKVLVTGATGLIGTSLIRALVAEGVGVNALVRDTVRAAARLPAGVTLFAWDMVAGPPPAAAFDGVGAVVNLAGESIADGRWSAARRKQLRDSRIVGTRALVNEIRGLAVRPRVLVPPRPVALRRSRRRDPRPRTRPPARLPGRDCPRMGGEASGGRARHARRDAADGAVLSRAGGFLRRCCRLSPGRGGQVGTGSSGFPGSTSTTRWRSSATRSTTARLGRPQCRRPRAGHQRELTRRSASCWPTDGAGRAPAFALRLIGGDMADELLLASQRAMPVRTLETASGFATRCSPRR